MTYVTPAKQTVAATVETLDIRNPGTTLLSLMRDPKSEIKETELPVADDDRPAQPVLRSRTEHHGTLRTSRRRH